METNWIQRY